MKPLLLLKSAVFFLLLQNISGQFPSICNKPENIRTKTCCPNNCNAPERGVCKNITKEVIAQWELGNTTITSILQDAPNQPQKGTIDARYLWPTIVFESVCVCNGNFWGVDCSDCGFGWTGEDCTVRKTPVLRRSFHSLTKEERQMVANATRDLKKEIGYWSVIVQEPTDYRSGTVTLQDVSTYDFFVHMHHYAVRDGACTKHVNMNISIDFAHLGPVFPVWHRRYLLTLEKEFQRILKNDSFGLPYWKWEENRMEPFTEEIYGIPSHAYGTKVNVSGLMINPNEWNTICDSHYWESEFSCSEIWRPCNPAQDRAEQRPLQRGGKEGFTYIPHQSEVMMTIAAPDYDAAADNIHDYSQYGPRNSFRSRLEGWNKMCSAVNCIGPSNPDNSYMHNAIHDWVGGQMSIVSTAANDPIFNLHHANMDRIFESWMKRFKRDHASITDLLPAYCPLSGGHPGHNHNDYMVPFFPLIKPGRQYHFAEEWGYRYDELIKADITDRTIADCSQVNDNQNCPTCDANSTCINCTTQTCRNNVSSSIEPSLSNATWQWSEA